MGDQLAEGFLAYDAETKHVLKCNEALQLMLGYASDEVHGMRIYDFFAHDREDLDSHVRLVLAGKHRRIEEYRYRRKDGSIVDVEASARAVDYGDRKAVCGVVREVTERRRQERASRVDQERLRLVMEAAGMGVWDWDFRTGEVVRSFVPERLLGLPSDGLSGGPEAIPENIHPEDRELARAAIARSLEGGEDYGVEYRVVQPDESIRWIATQGRVLRDDEGRPARMLGVTKETTERRRTEEEARHLAENLEARVAERTSELEAERARLEAVLRQMPSGVVIAEAPSGKVVLSNERAEQIRGRPLPPYLGGWERDEYEGLRPDGERYAPEEFPLVRTVRTGEEVRDEEMVITRGDGDRATVRVNSSPILDRDGRMVAGAAVFYDITEGRRAEERLRESEERFRATFEQAAVGIAHVGVDGRWLRVNQKLCDIVGYTQEELLRRTFQHITHPEDLDADLVQVRGLLEGKIRTYSMEKRYLRREGSSVWVNLTVSLVREPSGEPKYLIAVVEDIDERKGVERALRESEERFRLIAENAHDLISMTNLEARYTYVSPSHEAVLGYTAEALLAMSPFDLIPQEDTAQLADWENAPLTRFRARRADGSWLWMEGSSYTVTWRGETHVVGIARDITERKQAEEEIRRLNEQLERRVQERTAQLEEQKATLDIILDHLSEGVLATDVEGRVVFANPAVRAMFSLGAGDFPDETPDPWGDFKLPQAVSRCARQKESAKARVASGETVLQIGLEYVPGFDEGKGGVLVVIQDLSEGKRLEASQQRFLINAAHEFKTPITTILGAAELLLTEDEDDPETRRLFLGHIHSEGQRLQRFSDTMLRLARVGSDLGEFAPQAVHLGSTLEASVEPMKPLAERSGLELHVESDEAGWVRADPRWLEQALMVVLSNAVKYSARGGRVWLRARAGTITVEDEGEGIDEVDLPHVFERFYRGRQGAGQESGSGLGLAICKELIERMGGDISLESEEGVGTKVKIQLPEVRDV
ncbi:PAS domain S-box protein [Rubrobacter marinus]|uniref:PAS domain S-box protein n=1 Tax=Rubrobacter marinus TaxID=2653852 RepID=UPI00140A903D|nr:PAS domain S-box protein [Rubrobacter marinus]